MKRIAIVGGGAVGLSFAYLMKLAGMDPLVVVRRPEALQALKREGLVVEDVERRSRERIFIDVVLCTDLSNERFDLVVIATKAYDVSGALPIASKLCSDTCCVLGVQNGIGVHDLIHRVWGSRAVHAVLTMGATRLRDNVVKLVTRGRAFVGSASGVTDCVRTWIEILNAMGIDAHAVEDLEGWIWLKALVNSAINPLTTLLRSENGRLLEDELLELAKEVVKEGMEVARALGISLPRDPVMELVKILEETKLNRSSMLQDVEACRRTEIDYLCGAIARFGEARGLNVKLNRALTILIHAIEGRCRSS